MAYQHYHPEQFQETIAAYPTGLFKDDENTNQFFVKSAATALETVRENNKGRLKSFLDRENLTTICNMLAPLKRQVIIHSDYRPSNMLHKVKDDGTIEVIPVDYQTLQVGCPVIDLLYFIFTATDGPFRAKYYEKLVNHYHLEIGTSLARHGLDVEDKYSRKVFDYEMTERLKYGLLIAVLVLPILTVPGDQAPSMDDSTDMSHLAVKTTGPQYPDRLNEVIDDFIAWGVL